MLWLDGARVVCPASGRDEVGAVGIADGRIAHLGPGRPPPGAEVVNCAGLVVAPAFVDLAVHLCDPGGTWREDLRSGAAAAGEGGFARVVCAPDTDPVVDHAAVAREILLRPPPGARVDCAGALTRGLAGQELADIGDLVDAGCVALSDGRVAMADTLVLRRALEYARGFGVPVVLRPGDPALEAGGVVHEGELSLALGLRGVPAAAEEIGVARAVALCRLTGARLHLSHVTTARGLALLEGAQAEGLPLTGAVPARHLLLTEEEVDRTHYSTSTRLHPPLRPESDRRAVLDGVRRGALMVTADHLPWSRVEKELEFERAEPGAAGLETAAAATLEALDGDMGVAVRALAVAPAALLGGEARLRPGGPADLVLLGPAGAPRPGRTRSPFDPLRGRPFRWGVLGCWREGERIGGAPLRGSGPPGGLSEPRGG
jgi:dihydroorotase